MVYLYDTTLRDGMQGQGMNLSLNEKLKVVDYLDEYLVDYIEAGFFGANPDSVELFKKLETVELKHSKLVAFSMTRKKDTLAEDNRHLKGLKESPIEIVTLVGKTWGFHLEQVTKTSRSENLKMIHDSFSYLEDKQRIFDAEHFFAAYEDDPNYALTCLETAIKAGAFCVTLCDTNGAYTPEQIFEITDKVNTFLTSGFEDVPLIGIHAHNDLECAVANSLSAVRAGASLIQGTINGYGERCGNANLIALAPTLKLKKDTKINTLVDKSSYVAYQVAELVNQPLNPDAAYVGKHAFTHKGGMHIAGVITNPGTFEHCSPEAVGNSRSFATSDLSGKNSILAFAEDNGISLNKEQISQAVELLKQRESEGFQYESAEASFQLMLHKLFEGSKPLFELLEFNIDTRSNDDKLDTIANLILKVKGKTKSSFAKGNGPVNALDNALRECLTDAYPFIKELELTNYRVRILDADRGTAATTRVVLETTDHSDNTSWSTVGVSENIIEASWEALIDALEYAARRTAS